MASLHATASTSAAPRARRLDMRCMARKPTRLSQNKKNAKLRDNAEKARRTKLRRELNSRSTAPGELTPQQRVDAADHEARRWLGQHFLIDHSVILDALDAAAVTDGAWWWSTAASAARPPARARATSVWATP